MVGCETADGDKYTYAYDPFGRRVLKECKAKSVKTEFIWDGDVLAFEINGNQKVEWFFEPNSFRPMARRENGQLHYIVNDHLGTPKEAFTERGSLVWSVDHDTWGTVRKAWMSSALDPVPGEKGEFLGESFDGTPVHTLRTSGNTALKASVKPNPLFIPIRFQGQYEDVETGLFYNRFRYYEPVVGQYLSSDPIGIVGGFRGHGYVWKTSTQIDVFGLCCLSEAAQRLCNRDPIDIANGLGGASGPFGIISASDLAAMVAGGLMNNAATQEQRLGGDMVGHGGVNNLPDTALIDSTKAGIDPIHISGPYHPGATPGPSDIIADGNNRATRIAEMYNDGIIPGDCPIVVRRR